MIAPTEHAIPLDIRLSAPPCATPSKTPEQPKEQSLWKMGAHFAVGTAAIFAVVLLVGKYLRAPMEALGQGFLTRFGETGMGIGTFLADGFHFPVPSQFYMVAAISGGASKMAAIAAICLGSILGGQMGFFLCQRAARFAWIQKRLERSGRVADSLLKRYGYWGIALSSVTPIPYSMMCYLAGACRLPYKVVFTLSLFRIPVLIAFFLLIQAGWVGQ